MTPNSKLPPRLGRDALTPRPLLVQRAVNPHAPGSAHLRLGRTEILATVTLEDKPAPHMRGQKEGWLTAEYAMLPSATHDRMPRESMRGKVKGRTHEISRLVGRSLRAAVDLEELGENTIQLDCDVLQADGGTRTASITGAYVALADAIAHLKAEGVVPGEPLLDPIAAVSVGVIDGEICLDLPYEEDSRAEVDLNVVMQESGDFVEIQGTGEHGLFGREELNEMLDVAQKGCRELIAAQKAALGW